MLYPEKDFWLRFKKKLLSEWHNDALWGYNHTTGWHESGQEVHCYSAHSGDKASHMPPDNMLCFTPRLGPSATS